MQVYALLSSLSSVFSNLFFGDDLLSNSNESQTRSQIRVRLTDAENRDFRIALAVRGETTQDMLYRAIMDYIAATPLPSDTMLGKQAQ